MRGVRGVATGGVCAVIVALAAVLLIRNVFIPDVPFEVAVVEAFETSARKKNNFVQLKAHAPDVYEAYKARLAAQIKAHCSTHDCDGSGAVRAAEGIDPGALFQIFFDFFKAHADNINEVPDGELEALRLHLLGQYDYLMQAHSAELCRAFAAGGAVAKFAGAQALDADRTFSRSLEDLLALLVKAASRARAKPARRAPVPRAHHDAARDLLEARGGEIADLAHMADESRDAARVCSAMIAYLKGLDGLEPAVKRSLLLELTWSLMGGTAR